MSRWAVVNSVPSSEAWHGLLLKGCGRPVLNLTADEVARTRLAEDFQCKVPSREKTCPHPARGVAFRYGR